MKSYTDLEQSKRLAEILPIESADMYYFTIIRDYPYSQRKIKTIVKIMDGSFSSDYDTPCWSLTALLNLCPTINEKQPILTRGKLTRLWYCYYEDEMDTQTYSNPIDACVEMIEELHELKML